MEFAGTATRVVEAAPWLSIRYRMRPVLMVLVLGPVCQHLATVTMIRSQSGATVWIFEWYPVATKYPWTVQTKTGRLVCLVSSTLILDAEKRFHLMMRRRVRPFFMWSSSIDALVAPGEDCCFHKYGKGLMAPYQFSKSPSEKAQDLTTAQ